MKLLNVLAGILAILLLVLVGIFMFVMVTPMLESPEVVSSPTFTVQEAGSGGEYGYVVFNYRGTGNITVLALESEPKQKITVINDSQAVQAARLGELVAQLRTLEKYGYTVNVSSEPKIGDGITVIPTGALPAYALFNLQQNSSVGTVVYIGANDLILSNGIKQMNWYLMLPAQQKRRLITYGGTLDDFLSNRSVSLPDDILRNKWILRNSSVVRLDQGGTTTVALGMNGTRYMRVIYDLGPLSGLYDLPPVARPAYTIVPEPPSIYTWEKSDLRFSLNRTNGTAFLTIKKDGKVFTHEQLRRVTDANVFLEKLSFEAPGDYIITVSDNSGVIASGLLHLKDLRMALQERHGTTYVFMATVDGKPLENEQAVVWIGNSTDRRTFYVSKGQVVVSAKLEKGTNTFNFGIAGSTLSVPVENNQEQFLEFYIKYGLPGLAVVVAVYFGARMTRTPTYKLRFGDSTSYIRQEIKVPMASAMQAFRNIRRDMKLETEPITPQEFSVALKRYLTNGADVTEGNVEEALKRLEKAGYIESYREYYQLKGEGNVKDNALRRMIREKLIESGTVFEEREGRFITKDFEIGFFGTAFKKKGVIVVDDKSDARHLLSTMGEAEQAKLRLMQANDMLQFVSIDRLSDLL